MSSPKKGPEATIGGRIARARFQLAARQGKTVTQAWLAQQAGVSGPTVSQWESGITEPSLASVAKIAAALGVSPGWIAWGDQTTKPADQIGGLDDIEAGAVMLTPAQLARAEEQAAATLAAKRQAATNEPRARQPRKRAR